MARDKRCKCTFAQYMVGDGCRYCNPQEYIDKLQDIIEDMEKEYDELFNTKATVWHLKADK
jgi:hypothetical protein